MRGAGEGALEPSCVPSPSPTRRWRCARVRKDQVLERANLRPRPAALPSRPAPGTEKRAQGDRARPGFPCTRFASPASGEGLSTVLSLSEGGAAAEDPDVVACVVSQGQRWRGWA